MARGEWIRVYGTAKPHKRVERIDVCLVAADITGTIWATDVQLQDGAQVTGHTPAPSEMLRRERDAVGAVIPNRHYNVVIRGRRTIAVPNRAPVEEEINLHQRVTGGMDFTLVATAPAPPGGLEFAHQYRTRTFRLWDRLQPGDRFEFLASRLEVSINGTPTGNYVGRWHTCPAGFGRFEVSAPAGLLLCEPDQWLLGPGGERM